MEGNGDESGSHCVRQESGITGLFAAQFGKRAVSCGTQMFLIGLQSWFISELRTLRSQSREHLDVLSPATADATAVVRPAMPPFIPQPISDHLSSLPLSRQMGL